MDVGKAELIMASRCPLVLYTLMVVVGESYRDFHTWLFYTCSDLW